MFNYKFSNNSNDIKKLKKGLMSKSAKTDNTISSVRQVINEATGKILEKNIRQILQINYGFKTLNYPEKIFSKIIRVENDKNVQEKEIFQSEDTIINIKNKEYIFCFNEGFELIIKDSNNEIINIPSKKSNEESKVNIDGNKVTISPYKEMEIDGYFSMEKFEVNMFDEKEIEIIYSNINKDDEKCFTNSIIEVKLGANKVDDIIKQIRKDHHLLKLKNKKDTIVIGFMNSNKIKDRNHFNSLSHKCVIYGIKNSIFCGKEVTYQIDWDLEKRVKSLEATIDDLKTNLENRVRSLEATIDNLIPKINKIYEHILEQEKSEQKEGEEQKPKKHEKQYEKKKKKYKKHHNLLNIKTKKEYFEGEGENEDSEA